MHCVENTQSEIPLRRPTDRNDTPKEVFTQSHKPWGQVPLLLVKPRKGRHQACADSPQPILVGCDVPYSTPLGSGLVGVFASGGVAPGYSTCPLRGLSPHRLSSTSSSCHPPCLLPSLWRPPQGHYLAKVIVTSSGKKCYGVFRIVNDIDSLTDFRLIEANPDDRAKVL